MREQDLREIVHEALALYMGNAEGAIKRVQTFKEAGVLSRKIGLVIKAGNRSEFQMTIVKVK